MAHGVSATDDRRDHVLSGIVAGMIGGFVGSWTMNQFQALVGRATSSSQHASTNPDEDATQQLAQAIATHTIDRSLSPDEARVAGPVVHYAYGALAGALYGAVADRSEAIRSLGGAFYGTLLWVAGDEVAVPLFNLSRPSAEFSAAVHAQALAAHVVYGVTTELVRRGVVSFMHADTRRGVSRAWAS